VALLERKPALDAHKTVCTHYIQPSATPTIRRLGLAPVIEARGAVRNSIDLWTPYGGWIRTSGEPHGYNVTRRTLDPILRELAAETQGVDLLPGQAVVGLGGGVEVEDRSRARRRIAARLVVAADGRDSTVARLARVPGRVRPHNRFFYWAYWRGVRPVTTRSRMWFTEPDCAYTFPNEDDLTVVLVAPHRDRLPEFRRDLEGSYRSMLAALPDPPDVTGAERESRLLGKLELPNVSRPAVGNGVAFVGDAALASDPLWGVGCGWAFQRRVAGGRGGRHAGGRRRPRRGAGALPPHPPPPPGAAPLHDGRPGERPPRQPVRADDVHGLDARPERAVGVRAGRRPLRLTGAHVPPDDAGAHDRCRPAWLTSS